MTRNPYKVIEKTGYAAVIVFIVACVGLVLFVVVSQLLKDGWGWWTLLLIPGIPVGLFLVMLIGFLLSLASGAIDHRWTRAKWRWEDKHGRSSR